MGEPAKPAWGAQVTATTRASVQAALLRSAGHLEILLCAPDSSNKTGEPCRSPFWFSHQCCWIALLMNFITTPPNPI